MSESAVKARQSQLPDEFRQKLVLGGGAGGEDEDEDGEGGGSTVYDALGDWVQEEATKAGSIDKVDGIEIFVKAKEMGIETKHKTVLVLAQTLFNENVIIQIPKRAGIFKQVRSNPNPRPTSQKLRVANRPLVDHIRTSREGYAGRH